MHPSPIPAWILWSAVKKTKKIQTQFGAVKKSVPWANGGSYAEPYSSKILPGVQEAFWLRNISSLNWWLSFAFQTTISDGFTLRKTDQSLQK